MQRLLWTIPVLLIAILMTFLLVRGLPGDPFTKDPKVRSHPQIVKNLNEKYGLDKPMLVQYANYVSHVARFDFGPSMVQKETDVNEILIQRFPVSAKLGAMAFVVAAVVGSLLGMFSAVWVNRWPDHSTSTITSVAFAIPTFTTGTIVFTHLFDNGLAGWDTWSQRVGPVCVLAVAIVPYFTRLVRATMLETLHADFVLTAASKGLGVWRIRIRHVLRNSLIPVVNNAGPLLGFILTGSFIVEYIFGVPGIAADFVDSVEQQDYNVVMGTTVLLTIVIVTMNLLVDVLLAFLDPRIVHE